MPYSPCRYFTKEATDNGDERREERILTRRHRALVVGRQGEGLLKGHKTRLHAPLSRDVEAARARESRGSEKVGPHTLSSEREKSNVYTKEKHD